MSHKNRRQTLKHRRQAQMKRGLLRMRVKPDLEQVELLRRTLGPRSPKR